MAKAPETEGKKSKKGLIIIVAGALLVAALAGGGAYFFAARGHSSRPAVVEPEKPIFMALEPFTVNLKTEERDRYLHIGITLKLADPGTQAQMTQYLPELRSRILLLLSSHTPESLVSVESKNMLAAEILRTANLSFAPSQPQQKVTDVVFTAFVIQ